MDHNAAPQADPEREPYPALLYYLGRWVLKLSGWRLAAEMPSCPRLVIIAAPHTSNWDFLYAMASAMALRLRIKWLGKHTLFTFPLGGLLRAMGGIPVDRRQPGRLVEHVVGNIRRCRRAALLVPPSGSRRNAEYWKSGFYHIARLAEVPLLCSCLDYSRKTITVGCSFVPSGAISEDMDRIRAFYAGAHGKHPQFEGPIRLREEDQAV